MEANKFITNEKANMITQMNAKRVMVDEELKEIFGEDKEPTYADYECLIDSKANVQDVYTRKYLQQVMEAYYGSSPEIANEWYQQEMERRQAELNRQESIANMQNAVDNKISEVNETTNNKILEVDNRVNDKISEIDTVVGEKINEMDEKIVEVNSTKEDFTLAINNKISEANNKIDDVEDRMVFIENNFESMVDGTGFATQLFVKQQIEPKANKADVYTKTETYSKRDVDTQLKSHQNKINAIVNDSEKRDDSTWSSNKIDRELNTVKSNMEYAVSENTTNILKLQEQLGNSINFLNDFINVIKGDATVYNLKKLSDQINSIKDDLNNSTQVNANDEI